MRGPILRERSSQVGHAGFAKAMNGVARIGARRPSRTESDDLAVAAFDDQPPEQLAAK